MHNRKINYLCVLIQKKNTMKCTILQRDIVWAEPALNVRRADELIDHLPQSDLYVLPEMFSTGFCTEPENIAESADSETLHWMQQKAQAKQCAIAGSVAVQQDGKYYNRFYFVHPDGTYQQYDKKHLFTYGGEDKRFTAGKDRMIVTHCGVRILLQICYDLRFPVWTRNRKDYDMIIYVASWPTSRVEAWKTLLRARAIENQCYVAGVNRVGEDPVCTYCGGSALIDPYGRTLSSCEDQKESEASADIDMEVLNAFREKFPVLNDADKFKLE